MLETRARIFHRAVLICFDRIYREVMEQENYEDEMLDHALYVYCRVSERIDPDLKFWPLS